MIYKPSRTVLAALTDLIWSIAQASQARNFPPLAANLGVAGHDFDGGILVVGRAVNGSVHGVEWTASDIKFHAGSERWALRSAAIDKSCPLKWVVEAQGDDRHYNTNRSAFWRVSNALLQRREGEAYRDERWSSRLAWTNLYKVAPAYSGNPSDRLCEIQFDSCVKILREEITLMQPAQIVFVTGRHWLEWFEGPLGLKIEARSDPYVEAGGSFVVGSRSIPFAVAVRPDSRRRGMTEAGWTEAVAK